MAKIEIEVGGKDEHGICLARNTKLKLDGQDIEGVHRLSLDFPLSGAVTASVGLFASDGFRFEADGVVVKAEIKPLPGYELVVMDAADGSTVYYTRRIPVDVTPAGEESRRYVP